MIEKGWENLFSFLGPKRGPYFLVPHNYSHVVTDLLNVVEVHFTCLAEIQALGGDTDEAGVEAEQEEDRLQSYVAECT